METEANKMIKQPSYRFAGFEDEWKEVKLGEVSTHRSGTSIEKYFAENGVYKVISIGSYGLDGEYIDQGIRAISNEVTDQKIVKENELTMVLNDKTSNGTIIGRTLLIKSSNEFVVNQRTEIISPKEILDSQYAYVLLNGNFREQVKKIIQGGTQIYVNYSSVEQLKLFLPSLPEQEVIGSFFQDIDQLISLQQRRLEVLKEQKKTYLKLLFPAKGQTKPALRFAGFEDEWKEVKLGEIAELKRGLTYKPTSVVENGIRVLRSSNIDGDIFKKQEDDVFVEDSSATIPYVQFGDILITAANGSSKLVGKHAIIEDSEKMVHGGFMLLARSKEYKFLNSLLSSEWYSRFINVSVAGGNGTIGNLSKSNLEKEIVLCPTIPEQEAIGSFFQDLDKAIAKQEEKVNQLKESKQTLLRKMFI